MLAERAVAMAKVSPVDPFQGLADHALLVRAVRDLDLYDPAGSNMRQLKVTLDKSEKQLARLDRQRALLDEAIVDLQQLVSVVRGKLADGGVQNAAAN